MLPTHALIGVALALPVAVGFPEFASIALLGGLLGGIIPDLDMYLGHRKTLHYPIYYSGLAIVVVPVSVLTPTTATIGLTSMLIGAAVHSVMDIFGGGLELRPWEATSSRAVYDHHRSQWLAPRRWVRYDGAPEDFLLALAVGTPLLITLDGAFRWAVISSIIVAAVYTTVRRILPALVVLLVDRFLVSVLPNQVLANLPSRYLQDSNLQ